MGTTSIAGRAPQKKERSPIPNEKSAQEKARNSAAVFTLCREEGRDQSCIEQRVGGMPLKRRRESPSHTENGGKIKPAG